MEGSKLRTGLMGVLTRQKEAVSQPGVAPAPAPHSKPGRFANLRAKLSKPSEHAEVQHVGMFAVFECNPCCSIVFHMSSPLKAASDSFHIYSSITSITCILLQCKHALFSVDSVRWLLQRSTQLESCQQAMCACIYTCLHVGHWAVSTLKI